MSPSDAVLTDALLAHLYRKREWSTRRIGTAFGCSRETIRKRLKRLGIRRRPRSERIEPDLTLALYDLGRGKPIWEVALELEVSPQTLRRRLAEAGAYPTEYRGVGRPPKHPHLESYDRGREVTR